MGVTHTFVSAIADDPVAAAAGQILPSHWNATHTINVDLASEVSGVLPVANGGSGTATPSLVAGTNVTVTGTWPNQTIASTGGGTPGGSTTQLQYNNAGAFGGASGLTTNGTELTIASGTKTASAPAVDATQTWNNAAIGFTAIKLNITDTTSAGLSFFADFQVSTVSKFQFRKDGAVQIAGSLYGGNGAAPLWALSGGGLNLVDGRTIGWSSAGTFGSFSAGTSDLYMGRKAAASLQLGAADAAAPVAQTIGPQSVVAGTSNTAGVDFTIRGSQGTGTGAGGSLLFQTAPAGSSGTAQNALTTRLTITASGTANFGGAVVLPAAGSISFTSRGGFSASADGVLQTFNNASTDFNRLCIGLATSAFPSIKRSTTIAQIRLADDSAYAPLEASTVRTATAYTVATLPAAGTAGRRAYVTDATAPTFLGTLTGGGAVVCPVFDNGTAWVAG